MIKHKKVRVLAYDYSGGRKKSLNWSRSVWVTYHLKHYADKVEVLFGKSRQKLRIYCFGCDESGYLIH